MSDDRRVGRPSTTHCKRNHPRVPGEKCCIACRRLRERLKYKFDDGFRERKKVASRAYKQEFFDKNGFWPSLLYDSKPKKEATL